MIHNPRHRYCIDCSQRVMGPYICPNEMEHSDHTRHRSQRGHSQQKLKIEELISLEPC